ncbi:MAG: PAC2 family protein [Thermoplasmatota archaeon]
MNIEENEIKDMDLSEATALVSFPTVGMIGTIVSNYLVRKMDLELIGEFTSDEFPPVVIIHEGQPIQPVRIYGGFIKDPEGEKKEKVAVVMSEMPLQRGQFSPFAKKVIDWCKEKGVEEIITLEGINTDREFDGDDNIKVYSVGSLSKMDDMIERLPVQHMEDGMISGLSGSLLYHGKGKRMPVLCFLTEAYNQFPDSRSAAATIRVLNELFTDVRIDPQPLIEDAEKIEEQVKKAMKQISPKTPQETSSDNLRMYG